MGRAKPPVVGPDRHSDSYRGNRQIRARARKLLRERNAQLRKAGKAPGPKRLCKAGRRLTKAKLFGRVPF